MKLGKHKKSIEAFFQQKLPVLYKISYVQKRLKNNSEAFAYSFKMLKGMYAFGKIHYKIILAFLYLIWMIWQAYMISDVVSFSEWIYYIGLEYSAVLMIKIITILLLTIGVCFMTVWGMFFLPFFIACIVPAILIGNALSMYRYILHPLVVPGFTILYIIGINLYYYRNKHAKQVIIKAGVIIFYIFAGLCFTVFSTGILQKKTSEVIIKLRDEQVIEGRLHFYNGAKYFVSYPDEETWTITKEIINGISTISVEYK